MQQSGQIARLGVCCTPTLTEAGIQRQTGRLHENNPLMQPPRPVKSEYEECTGTRSRFNGSGSVCFRFLFLSHSRTSDIPNTGRREAGRNLTESEIKQ